MKCQDCELHRASLQQQHLLCSQWSLVSALRGAQKCITANPLAPHWALAWSWSVSKFWNYCMNLEGNLVICSLSASSLCGTKALCNGIAGVIHCACIYALTVCGYHNHARHAMLSAQGISPNLQSNSRCTASIWQCFDIHLLHVVRRYLNFLFL